MTAPAFIANQWYAVAWTAELGPGAMLARTILSVPLVIFRDSGGEAAALRDRCAHRHAPLSCGRVEADGIRCLYHGLKFAGDGRCIEIPGQERVPAQMRVESFPVAERDELIWAWFGDAARADPARIPSFPVHVDPAWKLRTGYTHVHAGYKLLIDNAMDLTHLAWCHMGTFGAVGASTVRPRLERRDGGLRYSYDYAASELPQFHRRVTGWRGTVDRRQSVEWVAPTCFRLDVRFTPNDPEDLRRGRGSAMLAGSSHLFTPETEHTTHYFWGVPLHVDFATEENLAAWYEIVRRGFEEEDRPMIEAQQRNLLASPGEPMYATQYDEAVLYARRMLERMERALDPES